MPFALRQRLQSWTGFRPTPETRGMLAMMLLCFVVVCAVGILRPIKNSLALDGLATTDFYKVYLVSAVVVLFVPIYNRLADRVAWRWLIPGVAFFFALNLLGFRVAYQEGSAAFGMVFYGWYDLFAAALVTQFYMATQLFFDTRNAKRAYPMIIAGGSIGATLGGAITGFFAETLGTPNLLLVAAGFIAIFSFSLPFVWSAQEEVEVAGRRRPRPVARLTAGELKAVLSNRHVRLIAGTVVLAVLVKQLVDYQFNTLSREIFETRDAVSAFQGKFNAATQWLPLIVLAALRPLLGRWGVGVAVFLLPVAMLLFNFGLALWFGLVAAVLAKGSDAAFRYAADRTGREILYLPVPESLRLKAKAYIDVAVEKGLGKAAAAGLIFGLLAIMEPRTIPFVAAGLALLWVGVAFAIRREYVRTLATSMQGRAVSARGLFVSIVDSSTLPVIRQALGADDPARAAFALDLIEQVPAEDVRPLAPDVARLLDHDSAELRARALHALGRMGDAADVESLRRMLDDPEPEVREAAVAALAEAHPEEAERLFTAHLSNGSGPARGAVLACLARGELPPDLGRALGAHLLERPPADNVGADRERKLEWAAGASALAGEPRAAAVLEPLLEDPDPLVAGAALRGAGLLRLEHAVPRMVAALGRRETRAAAREGLVRLGPDAVDGLLDALLDPGGDPVVRRQVPQVLVKIPTQAAVDGLLRSLPAPETDPLLDYRSLKALNKLRAADPTLVFDARAVGDWLAREVEAAERYTAAAAAVEESGAAEPLAALLARTLRESWAERRECAFRCLGLLHDPANVYRCYLAVVAGRRTARANALEWLERTLGHSQFRRLAPILEEPRRDGVRPPPVRKALAGLAAEEDPWLARCAAATAAILAPPVPAGMDADGAAAAGAISRAAPAPAAAGAAAVPGATLNDDEDGAMELIEKVFLLRQVDLLQGGRSAHLALLASIAEEVDAPANSVLVHAGEPPDALYVVVDGAVELRGAGERLLAQEGTPFGTWALIDEAPSVVEARTTKPSRLLRITRADFDDLLADHPELAKGMLQGLARRMRALAP